MNNKREKQLINRYGYKLGTIFMGIESSEFIQEMATIVCIIHSLILTYFVGVIMLLYFRGLFIPLNGATINKAGLLFLIWAYGFLFHVLIRVLLRILYMIVLSIVDIYRDISIGIGNYREKYKRKSHL